MAHVQIHCYGCGATTMVAESHMAEDLRYAGWSVAHGETHCRTCAAARGDDAESADDASPAGEAEDLALGTSPRFELDAYVPIGESRLARTLRLMRTALLVLRRDPRLLVFPAVAIVVNLVIGSVSVALAAAQSHGLAHAQQALFVWSLVASFPATYTTIFCGVALACMLASHFDGTPMSLSGAWRAALQRAAVIAAWTLLVCTVGILLRLLEQSLPRFVVVIIDLSWALLTIFAIPVLAYEQLGPIATFQRSRGLLRERWPEQIAGAAGLGVGSVLLSLPLLALLVVGLLAGGAGGMALVVAAALSLMVLFAVQTAAEQVFRICLYRFAVDADGPGRSPFAAGDLQRPFARRRRR